MVAHPGDRREQSYFARERNRVLLEHLLHSHHIRAHERIVGNHQRLVAVADGVRKERPLGRRPRPDHEHRLGPLDDDDDDMRVAEDQAVAGAQDGPARECRRELTPPSDRRRARAFSRSLPSRAS